MYQIGIDTGGTFTDFVVLKEETGELLTFKEPSSPEDPSIAVMRGLHGLKEQYDIQPLQISRIVYGTTVATNAVLEQKGAKTGLLTTKGFRDVLEIRRQWRPRLFDLYYIKPAPLVPRYLRLEVEERIDSKGRILKRLQLDEIKNHLKKFIAEGVEAVAVSFLFSFLNPLHEMEVEDFIKREFPQMFVSISFDVCPEFREYERTATTVLNAYLMPIMSKYVKNLISHLKEYGLACPLRIMQSNGGLMRAENIERTPINTLLSGPVGGVVGGVKIAQVLGLKNIITIDMGGTSTDISLIQDGQVELTTEAEIAYNPVKIPQVNINTIGAGGGSIVSLFGKGIKVGPQSAGAYPGPVCYGRGGYRPTFTDAALKLGYLDPNYFLGGRIKLDFKSSCQILEQEIAKPLGMTSEEAAFAILLVQSANIESGIRAVSVEKGYDPREFTLISFGGASALIIGMIAEQLSIPKVLIPRWASVFSALGLLMADIRRTRSLTRIMAAKELNLKEVEEIYRRLEEEVKESLFLEGGNLDQIIIQKSCDMRYIGQAYEINIPLPTSSELISKETIEELCHLFHVYHRKRFGHSAEEEPVELVCFRVLGILPIKGIKFFPLKRDKKGLPLKGYRPAYFGKENGYLECPIFEWSEMDLDLKVKGPAIIEDPITTIVVYPGNQAEIDEFGNIHLNITRREI
jgi:N-methylhydantoinase A